MRPLAGDRPGSETYPYFAPYLVVALLALSIAVLVILTSIETHPRWSDRKSSYSIGGSCQSLRSIQGKQSVPDERDGLSTARTTNGTPSMAREPSQQSTPSTSSSVPTAPHFSACVGALPHTGVHYRVLASIPAKIQSSTMVWSNRHDAWDFDANL